MSADGLPPLGETLKIIDLKCAVIGSHPVVRIVSDEGIDGFAQAEFWKPQIKPQILELREAILGLDPTHVEQVQEALEHIFLPGNRLIAAYLEARLGEERAREISFVVAGRGLVGMVMMMFLTQEILGAGRFLPLSEEEVTTTIAQVFLHGVVGERAETSA